MGQFCCKKAGLFKFFRPQLDLDLAFDKYFGVELSLFGES